MNTNIRILKYIVPALMACSMTGGCTRDAYGNSAVSPGGAAAIGIGALAAGAAIGAAVENNQDRHNRFRKWRPNPMPGPPPTAPRPRW